MGKLLPPTVGDRLAQCGTRVAGWGSTPGADVTLEVNAAPQTVTVNATSHTFVVGSLAPSARVRARQRIAPDQSEWSGEVIAEPVPPSPDPPRIEPTLPRCAQCIFAWGVAPGSKVEVRQGSLIAAEGIADRAGYACMTVKEPPPASYVTRTITCGAISADGHVNIAPPLAEIPPPTIVEPVFECQSAVAFQQLVPGASYEIFVTDVSAVQASLGTFCACTPNMTIGVPHSFKPGDKVKAIGSMINDRWQCQVRGRMSAEARVVPPDDRIKPVIGQPVWEGDAVIRVTNQIEGGSISLLRKADAQASQEDDLGTRPSSRNPEVSPGTTLKADNVIRVIQELCGVTRESDPVTVQKRPAVIGPPKIRRPVYQCAGIVIVDAVIPGATVWVREMAFGGPAPGFVIGKMVSSGSTAFVPVSPQPGMIYGVYAEQEIGGKFGPPSSPLVPTTIRGRLPPPRVLPPIRRGSTHVWCDELAAGAYVRLFNTRVVDGVAVFDQIGGGIATGVIAAIPVWGTIQAGARVSATQELCNESQRSEETVGESESLPCDGPPIWDPTKWNDGGTHQANNNCYNYGCDLRLGNYAQPGGFCPPPECHCQYVIAKALFDGLRKCTGDHCHPCHHKVALVMSPGWDFHWYRQDADGMWSHKRGDAPAKNVDEAGAPIVNPETANRGPYWFFCGYFCVYKADVNFH